MPPARIIAIDGPAASGKSTLGQRLAAKLGYLFFDTGAMYRAVTLAALKAQIDISDEDAVGKLANEVWIDVCPPSVADERHCDVLLDGEDVTWAIRGEDIDSHVSLVSSYKEVREAMGKRQREIGLRGNVVMVGRDIGTVILPESDLKIYLDASVEERSYRRHQENLERGEESTYEEVLEAMRERDRFDSTRDLAPLTAAPDAFVIDSTTMTIDEALDELFELASNSNEQISDQAELNNRPEDGVYVSRPDEPPLTGLRLSGNMAESTDRKRKKTKEYTHSEHEPVRKILRWLLSNIGFLTLAKIESVEGLENFPTHGPAIVIMNHIAFVDPLVVLGNLPRNVVPMAKAEVLQYPIVNIFPRLWDAIIVHREEFDRQALCRALAVLEAGEVILLAPEGTRNPSMQRGKEGVAYLGQRTGAPIVPVAVFGTKGFPSISPARWRKPGAVINIGKPFQFRVPKHRDLAILRQMTDEAMYVIAAMLPESLRGHYSDLSKATTEYINFL